jgi:xanthine dehydrogenase YagT iron-sulfur-binding subunit
MTAPEPDASIQRSAERAGETDASLNPISRRSVLQLAPGAALLAAVPGTAAQATSPTKQEAVPMTQVRLTINGQARSLDLDPRQSLLDLLRETLDLTGTKKGCNQGACGACTILLDGKRVNACLTLAIMHDGAEITTIEGLAKDEALHPLQAAFIEHDGFQCGYCTPGQIMSGIGCIDEGHAGSVEEIRFWMSGNICRCGAYPGIVAAIADVAEEI